MPYYPSGPKDDPGQKPPARRLVIRRVILGISVLLIAYGGIRLAVYAFDYNSSRRDSQNTRETKQEIEKSIRANQESIPGTETAIGTNVTDQAYFRFLTLLEKNTGRANFYWQNKAFGNLTELSSELLNSCYSNDPKLEDKYKEVITCLQEWCSVMNRNSEGDLINKLYQLADLKQYDLKSRIIALCSVLNPDMEIKIGERTYKSRSDFRNFLSELKESDNTGYLQYVSDNLGDFESYSLCPLPDFSCVFKESIKEVRRNPTLNSPIDITDELIDKILANNLESLTINYEFTRCPGENEKDDDWKNEQNRTNPFWSANRASSHLSHR